MDEREDFVKSIIIDKKSRILEIGPLNRPIVRKDEYPNSYYCDIRNTEQVKALYAGNDYLEATGIYIDLNEIVDIDYVLKDSYQDTFSGYEKFDYIVASHVMEHVEDLIAFLKDAATILKPEGKLCIIYPDKRYCFDHFREAASFRDAYDVYIRGRQETARMVLDFFYKSIDENNPNVFWGIEKINSLISKKPIEHAIEAYKKALMGERPDDVHYWPFTDYGFLRFLYDCVRARLIPFSCIQFHPTKENSQQFLTELKYEPKVIEQNEEELENLRYLMESPPLDYHNSTIIELGKTNEELKIELIEKEERCKILKEELIEKEERCKILKEELIEKEEKYKSLKNEFTEKEERCTILERKNIELNHSLDLLTMENEKLLDTYKELEKYNLQIKKSLSLLIEQKSQLLVQLGALLTIENSTIWRMTKPLRVVLDLIKKPFRNK